MSFEDLHEIRRAGKPTPALIRGSDRHAMSIRAGFPTPTEPRSWQGKGNEREARRELFGSLDWASETHAGFRSACDKKPRDAIIDFADDSRHASPWAATIHQDAIDRGNRHPHAVPILARTRKRIIRRCRQHHAAYHPTKHRAAVTLQAA